MTRIFSSLLTLSALIPLGCDPSPEPDLGERALDEATPAAADRGTIVDPGLARHAFSTDAAGGFVGANSDTVRVDAEGLAVRLGQDTLRFTLRSWGRADTPVAVASAMPRLGACASGAPTPDMDCARRVEQSHGSLTAWVARREGAVEQGWTLSERPEGAGPVELRLAVTGGELVAVERDAAVLSTRGVRWRYSGLKAWDADGKDLPAHLEPSAGGLSVVVDDAGARYPVEIDPSIVATEVKLTPLEPQGWIWPEKYNYGAAIRDIGDYNGDGYDDVAVGAPFDMAYNADLQTMCRHEGRVYLYFGGPLGVDPQSEQILDPHADGSYGYWKDQFPNSFPTGGGCHESRFGADIAAGDIDQDGKQDLVIGAPGSRNADSEFYPNQDWGRVWTYATYGYGYETPGAIPLFLRESCGVLWEQVGASVDLTNLDNIPWAFGLASAPARSKIGNGGGYYPEASQFFGCVDDAWAFNNCAASANSDWVSGEDNEATYDAFGHRSRVIGTLAENWANAAPLHGDYDEGRVYVGGWDVTGPAWYSAPLNNPSPTANGRFGWDIDDAGDVNGDGFNDLIVGAPGNKGSGAESGFAYLYLSKPEVPYFADNDVIKVLPASVKPGDQLGAVAGVGDVNKDGYDDLLLGAPGADNGASESGRAYVVFGGANGPDVANAIPLSPSEVKMNDFFGHRVSAAGDVNHDKKADLMVSACDHYQEELGWYGSMHGWCSGAVYVFNSP